ncbi:MAG: DUF222 domain-containing protein [Candidatus Dormibacteria bacterium]
MIATPLPSTSPQIDVIARAIDGLFAEDTGRHDDQVMGEDLIAMNTQINRLQAAFTQKLAASDRRRAADSWHSPASASWLRQRCHLSGSAASMQVHLARRFADLPNSEQCFRAGEISIQHAASISRSVHEVGINAVREAEPTLLESARQLNSRDFRIVTQHLRYVLDPDGALADDEKKYERRWFDISQTLDGFYAIDGLLDPESGATVKAALTAMIPPPTRDDVRDAGQRRADALVEMATRTLQSGTLPSVHGVRPHLTVTASMDCLAAVRGAQPGEIAGSGPIHPQAARRIACDASISVLGVDATGQPSVASRTSRTITAPLRTALRKRDGGCQFPGCDRPVEWTQFHHLGLFDPFRG